MKIIKMFSTSECEYYINDSYTLLVTRYTNGHMDINYITDGSQLDSDVVFALIKFLGKLLQSNNQHLFGNRICITNNTVYLSEEYFDTQLLSGGYEKFELDKEEKCFALQEHIEEDYKKLDKICMEIQEYLTQALNATLVRKCTDKSKIHKPRKNGKTVVIQIDDRMYVVEKAYTYTLKYDVVQCHSITDENDKHTLFIHSTEEMTHIDSSKLRASDKRAFNAMQLLKTEYASIGDTNWFI